MHCGNLILNTFHTFRLWKIYILIEPLRHIFLLFLNHCENFIFYRADILILYVPHGGRGEHITLFPNNPFEKVYNFWEIWEEFPYLLVRAILSQIDKLPVIHTENVY